MNIKLKYASIAMVVAGMLTLVACQSMERGTGQKASASLDSRSGSQAKGEVNFVWQGDDCLLYTSPSPRDYAASRMPSSA